MFVIDHVYRIDRVGGRVGSLAVRQTQRFCDPTSRKSLRFPSAVVRSTRGLVLMLCADVDRHCRGDLQ